MKPSFEDFIAPTKKYADIIIPWGRNNNVAIDLIVQHIHTKLGQHDICKFYSNLYVIHSTFQVHISNTGNNQLCNLKVVAKEKKKLFWYCLAPVIGFILCFYMSMKSMYGDLSGQYHIHAGTARNYGHMKALTSIFYLIYLFV